MPFWKISPALPSPSSSDMPSAPGWSWPCAAISGSPPPMPGWECLPPDWVWWKATSIFPGWCGRRACLDQKNGFSGGPGGCRNGSADRIGRRSRPARADFSTGGKPVSKILKNSFSSIRQTKRVIADCERDPNLQMISDPALSLVESTKTPDFKEATRAFLEKREKK